MTWWFRPPHTGRSATFTSGPGSTLSSARRFARRALAASLLAIGCRDGEPAATPAAKAAQPDPIAACVASLRGHGDVDGRVARALCAEIARHDVVGASVAMARGGQVVLALSVGRRCLDRPDPVEPTTSFRLGSTTKTLTAALAVRMAAAGVVDLDAPVATHLPAWPPTYADVTLRHLLDHTAGLSDVAPSRDNATRSGPDLVAALAAAPPRSAPGTAWHYANAGYALAGLALEHAGGRRFADLVREHVTGPGPLFAETDAPQQPACGHLDGRSLPMSEDLARLAFDARWTHPAGGVVMPAPDLAALAVRLARDLDVPASATVATDDPTWRYALGLRRRTSRDGTRVWTHAGDTGDFAADLLVLPDRDLAIVAMTNGGAHLPATLLAAAAIDGVDLAP